VGMIDFSLRKPEHGDSRFTAMLLSEPGGALGLEEHIIGEIEPLLRVFRRISGHQQLDQFLRSLPVQLRPYLSFDYMSVVLRKGDGDGKKWFVQDDQDPATLTCTQLVPGEDELSSWVVERQEATVIPNLREDIRFSDVNNSLKERALKSVCAVPLTTAHSHVGAILIGSTESDKYSQEYAEFFAAITDQIALVVDNALSHAELKRHEALARLSKSLSSSATEDLSRNLAAFLRPLLDFDFLDLIVFKEGTSEVLWHSIGAGELPPPDVPMEETTCWWVHQQQQPLCIADWKRDDRFAVRREALKKLGFEYRSLCRVPLRTPRRRLGMFSIASSRPHDYSEDEIRFLSQVADQVAIAVENGLLHSELRKLKHDLGEEKVYVENETRSELKFEEIVGKSQTLQQVLRQIEVVAPTDSGVLIQGETGTGKELIARAIHNLSSRRDQAFVKVNCAAIPSGLLESELFGHEKGAFTGAIMRKAGRFEVADKGTLFLDEVGDIPLELQPKLLRVLQEHEFERLGSTRTQQVDVRVIAATHRDLKQMVEDGEFRSDLFYRLHVFPLCVPPLRERREDIPILVRHYVDKSARRMNRRIETIPSQAMEVFASYPWPGNVRELQNFIERAVILSPGLALRPPLAELKQALQEPNSRLSTLEEAEREHVLRALRECNWVIAGASGAAARLGMKRTTLAYRIRKLKISCRPQ
jgi:formate hydrogenlyase transcriptional activator